MIFRKLSLRDFRRFARFEADFEPGLNVIFGNNEEGKSTLRQAITLALFEQPSTTKAEVLSLKRWGAAEQFAIKLEFDADGQRYVLSKDFQARSARLEESGSGQAWQDARTIDQRIKTLLGLPTAKAFESTVRVTQREITNIQDGKAVADRLQELATGGELDVLASKVIAELDRASKALATRSRGNPGPLAALPDQIRVKGDELEAKRRALALGDRARDGLIGKRVALAAAKRDLEDNENAEKACRERMALEEKRDRARTEEKLLEDRVDRIGQLQASIDSAEDELARYAAVLAPSAEEAAQIKALEMQAELARAALPPRFTELEPPAAERSARKMRSTVIAAGITLVLVGLVGGAFNIALLALALTGAALTTWELLRSRRSSRFDAKDREIQRRADEARQNAESSAARLEAALAQVACASTAEFYRRRSEGEELQRRVIKDKGEMAGLLGDHLTEGLAAIEEQRKAASREVRDYRERLEEPRMALAKKDQAGYQRLADETGRLRAIIEALETEIRELEVAAAINQIGSDELHCLEEDLEDLRERLSRAHERQEVLDLARAIVEEARKATMVAASDVLAREVGTLIAGITNGRYSQVRVDGNRLDLQLLSPERGAAVDVALDRELSTGTVEQVYLAARLAIAKLLANQRRPPFILDDPFTTFDAPRTSATLSLCQHLAAENQFLLFTCDETYVTFADNVLRLPELPSGESGSTLPEGDSLREVAPFAAEKGR